MAATAAVRPFAGGVPCRAAPVPPDASGCPSGKKRQCFASASRDSSAWLAAVEKFYMPSQKRKTHNRNDAKTAAGADTKILTVGGETPINPAEELLHKRLAAELEALHRIQKKAELISRGAGGAPTAGKKERFLAAKQRSEPMEKDVGNTPSAKRRKISTLVVQKQIQAPRMSPEERKQLGARLSLLSGELPGHIAEFLQQHFSDPNTPGEIEINIDSAEDSILFELKTQLDKFSEECKDRKIAEDGKDEAVMEQEEEYVDICGLSPIDDSEQVMVTAAQKLSEQLSGTARSTAQAAESVAGESIGGPATPTAAVPEAAQSSGTKKVQDVQRVAPKPVVSMACLIYRAKLSLELKAMEKTVLPDESIQPRDLQCFCIGEYGDPSLMHQLGLFLKADA